MNKAAMILEKAQLRLAKAEKEAREEQLKVEMSHLIAQSIVENGVYFYLDFPTNDLAFSSYKLDNTIH